jgi:hypothetical protein
LGGAQHGARARGEVIRLPLNPRIPILGEKTAEARFGYSISWGKAPHEATPQAKCKHQQLHQKSTNSYEIDIKRLGILTVLCRQKTIQ